MPNDSNYNTLTSKVISWIRFPLIFCVLIIHSNFSVITGGWGNLPIASWLSDKLSSIALVCNPAFFFISGLLFFHGGIFNKHIYIGKLKRRLHSLLIPYIAWNSIFLLILFLGELINNGFTAIIDKPIREFGLSDFLYAYIDVSLINGQGGLPAPVDGPLWFVRNLILIVILTPAISFIINQLSRIGKKFTFTILIGLVLLLNCVYTNNELLNNILFFSLGAFFSLEKINITEKLRIYSPFLLVASIVFYIVNLMLLSYISFILAIFPIIGIMLTRNYIKVNETLCQSTFFIFASHELVQGILYLLVRKGIIHYDHEWQAILCIVLFPVIMATTCLIAFLILRRIAPKFTNLVTGNRIH